MEKQTQAERFREIDAQLDLRLKSLNVYTIVAIVVITVIWLFAVDLKRTQLDAQWSQIDAAQMKARYHNMIQERIRI